MSTVQDEASSRWSAKTPRIFSGAISRLRFCRKRDFLIADDISNGRENIKIPAVSFKRNDKAPSDYHYVTNHIQYEPLFVDRSLQNMASCKCLDDCADGGCYCTSDHASGRAYNSKGRLASEYDVNSPEVLYECNAGCNCNKKNCKNSVIQGGLKSRLMLFRTRTRGWGVRTLEALERGTFIGVYSGELISVANSQKRQDDTYLFNLASTHIYYQNAEPVKQEDAVTKQEEEADEELTNCRAEDSSVDVSEHRHDEEEAEKKNRQQAGTTTIVKEVTQPVEQYVCDAKFYGNVTRFINHSCEPNVIGIRSFTDHQDKRFPHIAFFTNKQVPANTELTLNYGDNYWLVKCKRDNVYCLCKKPTCRFSRKTFSETLKQHNRMKHKAEGNTH